MHCFTISGCRFKDSGIGTGNTDQLSALPSEHIPVYQVHHATPDDQVQLPSDNLDLHIKSSEVNIDKGNVPLQCVTSQSDYGTQLIAEQEKGDDSSIQFTTNDDEPTYPKVLGVQEDYDHATSLLLDSKKSLNSESIQQGDVGDDNLELAISSIESTSIRDNPLGNSNDPPAPVERPHSLYYDPTENDSLLFSTYDTSELSTEDDQYNPYARPDIERQHEEPSDGCNLKGPDSTDCPENLTMNPPGNGGYWPGFHPHPMHGYAVPPPLHPAYYPGYVYPPEVYPMHNMQTPPSEPDEQPRQNNHYQPYVPHLHQMPFHQPHIAQPRSPMGCGYAPMAQGFSPSHSPAMQPSQIRQTSPVRHQRPPFRQRHQSPAQQHQSPAGYQSSPDIYQPSPDQHLPSPDRRQPLAAKQSQSNASSQKPCSRPRVNRNAGSSSQVYAIHYTVLCGLLLVLLFSLLVFVSPVLLSGICIPCLTYWSLSLLFNSMVFIFPV